jgi:predicted nucleic acid-binding protein
MKPTVYIETTVVSYLTARPSRDVVRLAQQQITREWWDRQRVHFELFVSQLVLREAAQGDPTAAADRLRLLASMQTLAITSEAEELAIALLDESALPRKAAADALHIAIAAMNGIDFVLTWNCRHMANAIMQPAIQRVCLAGNVIAPTICTPETLQEIDP